MSADDLVVATDNPTLDFSTATLSLGGQVDVGNNAGEVGTLTMGPTTTSNTATLTSGDSWYIGANGGTGVLNSTNVFDKLSNGGGIFVGLGAGSNGTIIATDTITNSGFFSSSGELLIGGITGSSGTGGTGSVTITGRNNAPVQFGDGIFVGRGGAGTLTMNGGDAYSGNGGDADIAIGDLSNGTGTVTLTGAGISASGYLSVGGGERTNATTAGGTGVLNVNSGSMAGGNSAIVGASGGTGTVNVNGGSSFSAGTLTVGDGGTGVITVNGNGSEGSVGASSYMYVGGNGGTGSVSITDRSYLEPANLVIGADQAGLPGSGSVQLTNNSTLFATGVIDVESTGSLSSDKFSNVEFNTLNLTNAGSLNLSGSLEFTGSNAELIDPNFTLTAGLFADGNGAGTVVGNLINSGSLGQGTFTIDGNYTQTSAGVINNPGLITIDGTATLAGTLLLNDYPDGGYVGEQFQIFDFKSTVSGQFSNIDLPPLPPTYEWSTANLYTEGVITIIPEPAGLIAMAAGMVLMRRTRRHRAIAPASV
jgi:fibronectin-binding autotransporter adhesin